jgi:hypothetical protein
MKTAFVPLAVLFGCFAPCVPVLGQEANDAKSRLAVMQRVIEQFAGESDQIKSKSALRFRDKPLLRYSDATRGTQDDNTLHDASVWRLGTAGRPTALVTLEVYRASDKDAQLSFEFISFAEQPFALKLEGEDKIAWKATGTDLKWQALADAPPPAKSASGRLVQMRAIARRFTVREELMGNLIECRLLAQPIDRYDDEDAGIIDGAIFAYANGTNPEACLVVECTGKGWSYGTLRMGAAKLSVELDGREVASYPPFGDYGRRDGKYTSMSQPIDLP